MLHRHLEIASTPNVKPARDRYGSAGQDARLDGTLDMDEPVRNDRLGRTEAVFIFGRDGFNLGSSSKTGWPYVQFGNGSAEFLRGSTDARSAMPTFAATRYITTGNIFANDRVLLFPRDYAQQRRLEVLWRMYMMNAREDPVPLTKLAVAGSSGRVEGEVLIEVEAFDWEKPAAQRPTLHPGRA